MKFNLKILYDNEAKPGFEKGWGFSCLAELEDENILFDTGWDGKVLLSNMQMFGIKPEELDKVVISHSHWDHSGGLTQIRRENLDVYLVKDFADRVNEELIYRVKPHSVENAEEITDGVWTTGQLGEEIKEQSLIIETDRGIFVLVGCAHPGLGNIFSVASEYGDICGVIGGLHDFEDYEVLEDLEVIVPCHCTVNKEKISEMFPEAYREGKVGVYVSP